MARPEHCTPCMETDVTESISFYKVWAWLEVRKKPVAWCAAILVALGLFIWFLIWQHDEKEIAAGQALSGVLLAQNTTRSNLSGAYLKLASTYSDSSAGPRALLLAAGSLFIEGQYDQAKTQFDRFRREYGDNPMVGEALLGIAACLDAQGKTDEAIAAYGDLVQRHPGQSVIPQAKFALARLFEAQNKPEPARNLFEDVYRSNPYDSLGSEAGMRLEELRMKYPALFPTAPSPTNNMPITLEKP